MMAAIKERVGRPAWLLVALVAALTVASAATPAAASTNPSRLTAFMSGAKEVPGPGDPDGRGRADITLRDGRVCFNVSWRNIDAPTAAHIHVGKRGVAGPVVVLLFNAPSGIPSTINEVGGCVTADNALVRAIRQAPRDYYVNVHNVVYPDGAIRGQLRPRRTT